MKRIDSHQHFWQFDPVRDSWINDEMSVIQRDFLPADLQPVLEANGFGGCVVVQSDQSEQENEFQLKNAESNSFIKGVVGWVDLRAGNVEQRLEHYSQYPRLKGFRHVLQGEPRRDLMLQPNFMNGVSKLGKYGFTYDILIFPDQLQYVPAFVSAFPDQRFVVDHIAKPYIKDGKIEEWKRDISAVAKFENLYCKISGMVTEADWRNWKAIDVMPYIEVVVDAFGTDRVMFGSDWPVCLVAAEYKAVVEIVDTYFAGFSQEEKDKVFGGNATRFYNL